MSELHLLLGPVGAGKSTLARELVAERQAVAFDLDQWMAVLFRPDRPDDGLIAWYRERAARCVDLIFRQSRQAAQQRTPVVLEIGLILRRERLSFYRRVDEAGLPLVVHLLDAPREVRRERVAKRNQQRGPTFNMEVPPDIFEMASDLWEPPTEEELAGRRVIRRSPT